MAPTRAYSSGASIRYPPHCPLVLILHVSKNCFGITSSKIEFQTDSLTLTSLEYFLSSRKNMEFETAKFKRYFATYVQ